MVGTIDGVEEDGSGVGMYVGAENVGKIDGI